MTVELVESKNPCVECAKPFMRPKQKGRPPTRCPDCKEAHSQAEVEKQAAIVAAVNPETLWSGSKAALRGSKTYRPIGANAQCVNCWRVFSSDSGCEGHKDYRKNPPCIDPATLGYVAKEKKGYQAGGSDVIAIPVWVKPSDRFLDLDEEPLVD